MKYQHVKGIAEYLGNWLYQMVVLPIENKIDLITATPLHPKREDWRGFNQAKLISQAFAKHLEIPFVMIVEKTKKTKNQAATKDSEERSKNLREVFNVKKNWQNKLANKSILIVDDVLTTGSTLNEIAKILKASGAKNVYGVTFARKF